MSPNADPVHSIVQRYAEAVRAKDVDAFMDLFTPDALIFDAWDRWQYDDASDWRAVVDAWFGSLGSTTVVVEASALQSHVGGDIAAGHGDLVFAAVDADGTRRRSMTNRATWLLRHAAGAWRIAHFHTSLPVQFGSMVAVLRC